MHCSSPVSARCVCVWVVEPHTGCGASGWPCMALGGRVVSGLRGAWAYMHMLALPASLQRGALLCQVAGGEWGQHFLLL